jgi:hypothetical protein
MFLAHGNFGILTIDHRGDVGLAPWRWRVGVRATIVACHSAAHGRFQDRRDDCLMLFAAMSPCWPRDGMGNHVMEKGETLKV